MASHAGPAYYVKDLPGLRHQGTVAKPLRMIVLDTVNENGEADGSLDALQYAWLLITLAEQPARLTVVLGHHTGDTMANPLVATGGDLSPRSCARETPRRGVRRVPVGRVPRDGRSERGQR